MTLRIIVALAVCLIGGLFFLLSKDGDRKQLALHAFWCGLLVALFHVGTKTIALP
jgi:hypothetical protein